MKNRSTISYKFILVSVILLMVLILGTMISMRVMLRDVQTASGYTDENYTRHYAFIRSDENKDFWENVYLGAKTRGEEMGVYVEEIGQDLTVDYDRNELMQIAMDAGVDGIIVEGTEEEQLRRLIDSAAAKDIPVVTVFGDCAASKRISFVGISGYATGRQYGEKIIKHISEDGLHVSVLIESGKTNSNQELVISGIMDVFEEAGWGEYLQVDGLAIDDSAVFSSEEDIRDLFLKKDFPDVIVALTPVYTRCLFQAAVDYNRVGDVCLYGFHDSSDILDAVAKDILEATISVDTEKMGASSVEALEEYITTGYVSTYITQDTTMIDAKEAASRLKNENEDTVE